MSTTTDHTETPAIEGPDTLRRRLVFTAIGLVQGVALYLIDEYGVQWIATTAGRHAIGLFCALAPVLAYLTFDRRRWADTVAFSVTLAALTAALHLWIAARVDFQPPTSGSVCCCTAR